MVAETVWEQWRWLVSGYILQVEKPKGFADGCIWGVRKESSQALESFGWSSWKDGHTRNAGAEVREGRPETRFGASVWCPVDVLVQTLGKLMRCMEHEDGAKRC